MNNNSKRKEPLDLLSWIGLVLFIIAALIAGIGCGILHLTTMGYIAISLASLALILIITNQANDM